jgi:hypothetical protein
MNNKEVGIVVIAYNRVTSIQRLLSSLECADYLDDNVDLIISIDYHEEQNKKILEVANSFNWLNGRKIIVDHKNNLGLKKHILSCGEYLEEYNNVCVLEDDIYVSPGFYSFIKQAINFYSNTSSIAGFSLYSHQFNYIKNRFFSPLKNGYDTYFMQQAQSWGQVWNKNSWEEFTYWLSKGVSKSKDFPVEIYNWPDTSWLKLQMQFLVEKNKYFVYPYISLSTNFSDDGTHAISSTKYQVALLNLKNKTYNFPVFNNEALKYDVYFESNLIKFFIEKEINATGKVTVDLYQAKQNNKRYLLTTKRLNFKIIKKYGLKLRPHEINVLLNYSGEGIYLYDTFSLEKNLFIEKVNLLLYDSKIDSIKTTMSILKILLQNKVKRYFKK